MSHQTVHRAYRGRTRAPFRSRSRVPSAVRSRAAGQATGSALLIAFLVGAACGAGAYAWFMLPDSGAPPMGMVEDAIDHGPSSAGETAGNGDEPEFEFWDRLPRSGPVADPSAYTPRPPRDSADAVEYLVQAGSFRRFSDAETRRAELLLEGLDVTTKEISLDNQGTYFRVLVGPFSTRLDTDRALTRLRGMDIAGLLLTRPATE